MLPRRVLTQVIGAMRKHGVDFGGVIRLGAEVGSF